MKNVTRPDCTRPDKRAQRAPGLIVLGASTIGTILMGIILALPALAHAQPVSFSKEIAPIIQRRCVGCHGERTNLGEWRAHTFAALLKSGASGKAMIVPGKPEASELYRRILTKDEDMRMPKSDDALDARQLFGEALDHGRREVRRHNEDDAAKNTSRATDAPSRTSELPDAGASAGAGFYAGGESSRGGGLQRSDTLGRRNG